jgi:3-oxoacyl-[acyl-carrier protein] reductase
MAGADVVVHCRESQIAAHDVRRKILELGRNCEVIVADLSDELQFERFVAEAWSYWGSIEIWINNAGVDLLTGPAAKLEFPAKLERLFQVDMRATMLLSRLAGRRMRTAGKGVIVNIGWDQADRGMEGDSGELFAAAKNAIMGFTRSLSLSLAPEVRVNCIAPGWIRTAWGNQAGEVWQQRVIRETPLGRWGTPGDIARLARFLVSDDAAYITGQVINANGGAVR